jgi:hypothetical protein
LSENAITASAAPRVLGAFSDLRELQVLMRARADELQISREQIDEIAGFTPGYASKVLAPRPIKKMGELSIRLLLGALAIDLIAVDNAKQRERVVSRRTERHSALDRHAGAVTFIFSQRHMRKIQKRGGENSRKYMTREQASRLASKAGRQSHKNLSPQRARKLAQARGRAGAAARWGDIKRAVKMSPTPILTDEQVLALRARARGQHGEQIRLAREFGITPRTVSAILLGKRRNGPGRPPKGNGSSAHHRAR